MPKKYQIIYATPQELRAIADFRDCWGNEVENDIELSGRIYE